MNDSAKPFSIPHGWSVSQLLSARKPNSEPLFDLKPKIEPLEPPEPATIFHGTTTNPKIKSEPIEQVAVSQATSKSNIAVKKEIPDEPSISESKLYIKPESDERQSAIHPNLSPTSIASIDTGRDRSLSPKTSISQDGSKHKPPKFQSRYEGVLSGLYFAFTGEQKPWSKSVMAHIIQRYGGSVRNLKKFYKQVPVQFGLTIIVGDGVGSGSKPKKGPHKVRVIDQKTFLYEMKMKAKEKELTDRIQSTVEEAKERARRDWARLERRYGGLGANYKELKKEAKELQEDEYRNSRPRTKHSAVRDEHKQQKAAKQRAAAATTPKNNGPSKHRDAVPQPRQMRLTGSSVKMEPRRGENIKQEENMGIIKNQDS